LSLPTISQSQLIDQEALRERDFCRDSEEAETHYDYLDRGPETAVEPRVREKTGRDYEGMRAAMSGLQMHQPALQRSDDRLRTIVHIQAAEDSADMALHGCFGNAERLCDVLVAFADDQQTQHLKFARA